jgi:hypothetical protein
LSATGRKPKTADDFIEDQECPGFCGRLLYRLVIVGRTGPQPTVVHGGVDENGGDVAAVEQHPSLGASRAYLTE